MLPSAPAARPAPERPATAVCPLFDTLASKIIPVIDHTAGRHATAGALHSVAPGRPGIAARRALRDDHGESLPVLPVGAVAMGESQRSDAYHERASGPWPAAARSRAGGSAGGAGRAAGRAGAGPGR